jgi:large subunit ribosomal protein L9
MSDTKVILTDEVRGLGHRGDVVSVAPGYARNFLLPKALALLATEGNTKRLKQEKRSYDARMASEEQQARAISEAMQGVKLVLKKKAGEHEALYGSVTTSDLAEALAVKGITVDRRRIELEEPIKRLGTHKVRVKLHHQVTSEVTVEVLPL